MLYVPF